ncbi:MAG: YjbQ family protein [Verrucomicrobia bacterium]|nr:YjbQ family protein [Verrucomicrobiota bacterium]
MLAVVAVSNFWHSHTLQSVRVPGAKQRNRQAGRARARVAEKIACSDDGSHSLSSLSLIEDSPGLLDRPIPPSRNYGHERAWHDGNGHSHLQATLLGPSMTVAIRDGRLVLGTWQQIFHLECDVRPRSRTIYVTVMGE